MAKDKTQQKEKIKTPIERYIINAVKEQREKKKFTQEGLSFALNLNHAFVSNRENGSKIYNANHLNSIAKVLKCSPKEFWPDTHL